MSFLEGMNLLVGAVTGIGVVVFALYGRFILAPVLELEILPQPWRADSRYILLGCRVRNTSHVRVERPIITLNVTFYSENVGQLGPRSADNPEGRSLAEMRINSRDSRLFCGESSYKELLIPSPNDAVVAFAELEMRLPLGRMRRLLIWKHGDWAQRTCRVVLRELSPVPAS